MARVYVAGPYTQGDTALNVRRAIEAGERLYTAGHIPYIPHLTHFWHMIFPRPYHEWLELDKHWVRLCHALLRLKGDSAGADQEVTLAYTLKMPVFLESMGSLDQAIRAITKWQEEVKD